MSRKIKFLRSAASNGLNVLIAKLKEADHDVKKLKISGSRYRGNGSDLVFNWGRSDYGSIANSYATLNVPDAVVLSSSKAKTFKALQDAGMENSIPKWTQDIATAGQWILNQGEKVYCRTLTRASQGKGIVIATTQDELVSAPLYTAGVDVAREVRVHVFKGTVIDFAQKKRMSSERLRDEEIEEADDNIRSHGRGWVFARSGVEVSDAVKDVAIRAVSALGLDFGAVDIAITPQGVAKIYEVNSAPGLEGTTLESYSRAFLGYIEECS